MDDSFIKPHILKRPKDGHKGTLKDTDNNGLRRNDRRGMLSALSAFKSGSGLVYLAVPQSLATIYSVGYS